MPSVVGSAMAPPPTTAKRATSAIAVASSVRRRLSRTLTHCWRTHQRVASVTGASAKARPSSVSTGRNATPSRIVSRCSWMLARAERGRLDGAGDGPDAADRLVGHRPDRRGWRPLMPWPPRGGRPAPVERQEDVADEADGRRKDERHRQPHDRGEGRPEQRAAEPGDVRDVLFDRHEGRAVGDRHAAHELVEQDELEPACTSDPTAVTRARSRPPGWRPARRDKAPGRPRRSAG